MSRAWIAYKEEGAKSELQFENGKIVKFENLGDDKKAFEEQLAKVVGVSIDARGSGEGKKGKDTYKFKVVVDTVFDIGAGHVATNKVTMLCLDPEASRGRAIYEITARK